MRQAFLAPVLLVLCLSGCGSSPALSLNSYRTSCSTATDCVAVAIGDVCTSCACPDSAINRADQQKYSTDFAQARSQCGKQPVCTAQCTSPQVACTGGTCTVSK